MGTGTQRTCRKCLLRDMEERESYKNMYEYIRLLPEEDKTLKEEYDQRLERCKECEHLTGGMCRICGCFVEMRAAMKVRHCPGVEKRW